jgi:hypothetical protein
MRVDVTDRVVGVTAVTWQQWRLAQQRDGKGTIRLMSGFSANKAPGAGGKIALKTRPTGGRSQRYRQRRHFSHFPPGQIDPLPGR